MKYSQSQSITVSKQKAFVSYKQYNAPKMLHIMYKPGKTVKHVIIICTDTVNYLYTHTYYCTVLLLKISC